MERPKHFETLRLFQCLTTVREKKCEEEKRLATTYFAEIPHRHVAPSVLETAGASAVNLEFLFRYAALFVPNFYDNVQKVLRAFSAVPVETTPASFFF